MGQPAKKTELIELAKSNPDLVAYILDNKNEVREIVHAVNVLQGKFESSEDAPVPRKARTTARTTARQGNRWGRSGEPKNIADARTRLKAAETEEQKEKLLAWIEERKDGSAPEKPAAKVAKTAKPMRVVPKGKTRNAAGPWGKEGVPPDAEECDRRHRLHGVKPKVRKMLENLRAKYEAATAAKEEKAKAKAEKEGAGDAESPLQHASA